MQEQAAPLNIPMTLCESSQIAAHGYDEATQTLALTFKGGGATYHYDAVPPEVYAELCAADSIGSFFYANVRHAPYAYRKVSGPQKKDADER